MNLKRRLARAERVLKQGGRGGPPVKRSEFLAMDLQGVPRAVIEAMDLLAAHDVALSLPVPLPLVRRVSPAMREWKANHAKVESFLRAGLTQEQAEEAASANPDAGTLLLDVLPRYRQRL